MRRLLDRLLFGAAAACAALACALLAVFLGAILLRGLPVVSWSFLGEEMRLAGAGGGILYNVIGTLILITTAALVCAPLALGIALTHGFYLRSRPARRVLELFLYVLNGVPSILLGILGLIVFVHFLGWGKSWLSGGLLLALLILPTVCVAVIERMRVLPARQIEAASALGLTRSQIVRAVVLPQSAGGLLTGLLLGLARAAGETAPILFTATIFAGATLPHGVRDSPVLSLPYHVFVLAQDSADPAVAERVWGAAAVLLFLVFLLSAIALPLRLRVHEEAGDG